VNIDVPSAVLATSGLALLVDDLAQSASTSWTSATVAVPVLLSMGLLAAFGIRQATATTALLPLDIVTQPQRGGSFVSLALGSFANFGMALILTYYLQVVLRYSPLGTAVALVPFAVATTVGAGFAGPKLIRVLPLRTLVVPALAPAAAGLLVIAIAVSAAELWPIVFAEVLVGFGTGLSGTPAQVAIMRGVETTQAGAASAMSSTSNQIGGAIGSTLMSTLAVSASAAYASSNAGAGSVSAAAHGYAAAVQLGALVVLIGALLAGLLIGSNVRPLSASSPTR
jgi:hypothetical protein